MLLHSYKITRTLPCLADPMKIRVIAEVSDEIHEVFPYLNAILKACIYNHPANTLTIKKDGKLLTLHFRHITLAKIEDEKEAEEILKWLQDLINETYDKRDQVEPNYSMVADLKALDIFRLLPGTNCKRCAEPTCLAFSVKLAARDIEIIKCTPLFSGSYEDKFKVLMDLLRAAGHDIPNSYSDSEKE
jgi:ArsR family metal-binding transcriptional regulator